MQATPNAPPPLAGVKVVDLTEQLAGPYCTMILGDMGAEVIKVERPVVGDTTRGMGDGSKRNPYFRYVNRNKKSLTLNIKHPEGRQLLLNLAKQCDVLVENYRPGAMDRAGLGWEDLHACNPRLIYASLSGFGSSGPYRERGGFDLIAQGMGGLMHVTGEEDGPPMSVGVPVCDLGTGMWGVQGILAALWQRAHSGMGQRIGCSLLETAVAYSSWTSASWLANPVEPTRQGSRHRQNAPYQSFGAKDGYIMVGAASQAIWERFTDAVSHPELKLDVRFTSRQDRRENRHVLEGILTPIFATRRVAEWLEILDAAGVPCGPVNTYEQVFNDPQVKHQQMVVHVQDDELGNVPHLRIPVEMSGAQVAVRQVAPRLGQHTKEMLHTLGVDAAKHKALQKAGVV